MMVNYPYFERWKYVLGFDDGEMLFIVLLEGFGEYGGVKINRADFVKIFKDFSQLSIGCGFNDILLNFFLLF